ncbi:MAG TPA: hypothetical protein VLC09_20115 [Polyangiaceae bacterium]|nr:hypothetical protein [Polyangiaceae bacterium]
MNWALVLVVVLLAFGATVGALVSAQAIRSLARWQDNLIWWPLVRQWALVDLRWGLAWFFVCSGGIAWILR